jgi:hypothetical protein
LPFLVLRPVAPARCAAAVKQIGDLALLNCSASLAWLCVAGVRGERFETYNCFRSVT